MSRPKVSQRKQPAAAGGPAAERGLAYQADYAILRALQLISENQIEPLPRGEVTLEARTLANRELLCWDVRFGPPEVLTEAKLSPTNPEVLAWLSRAAESLSGRDDGIGELVHGQGAPVLIRAVQRLIDLAREAGSPARFKQFLQAQSIPRGAEVLKELGKDAFHLLTRLQLESFEERQLKRDVRLFCLSLVGPDRAKAFHEFLHFRFREAASRRETMSVASLMAEAEARGFEFAPPRFGNPSSLPPAAMRALFLLQRRDVGLPRAVVAAAVHLGEKELDDALREFISPELFQLEHGIYSVRSLRTKFNVPDGPKLAAAALKKLLDYIALNESNPLGRSQLRNAVQLAHSCELEEPDLVSSVFNRLNSMLKSTGDKLLVLEAADLSIKAVEKHERSPEQTWNYAVALICGRSWVLQRYGELEHAWADAKKSLALGEALVALSQAKANRNTAFCKKCLGRLHRLLAERASSEKEKEQHYLDSMRSLSDAVKLFPKTDQGEKQQKSETGDCYSLAARTALSWGRQDEAEKYAKKAMPLITDENSKDFADLQIVLGDLRLLTRLSEAIGHYDRAIQVASAENDAQRSEIAARAYLRRGIATENRDSDLEAAMRIWEDLDDSENAAHAAWEQRRLIGFPDGAEKALLMESYCVRMEALRLHDAKLAAVVGTFRGRRSSVAREYWKQLIPEARANVAVSQPMFR